MSLRGWATAFALTLLFEGPLYLLLLRSALSPWRALAATLALNLATHPIAWSAITMAAQPFPWVFVGVEAAVALAEGLLLFAAARTRLFRRRLGLAEALAIALAANGFSAGLGLML